MLIDYDKIAAKTLSYSSLKEFARSPEHFVQYMTEKKAPTPAMMFGSLVDSLILTPDTWQEQFVIRPDKMPFKKDLVEEFGKELGAQKYEAFKKENAVFLETNKGKMFITQEDFDKATTIAEKVFGNERAAELLARLTQTQETIFFTDKATGLKVVCKLDGRGEGIVMDLKTCANADPDDFVRAALNFDYDLQTGTYLTGVAKNFFEFPEYYFLCVETTAPFGISVLKASDEFIDRGKKRLRQTLDNYKYALDNKLFHQSYEFRNMFGPAILELPKWARLDD